MNSDVKEVIKAIIVVSACMLCVGIIATISAIRNRNEKIEIFQRGYMIGQRDALLGRTNVRLVSDTTVEWIPNSKKTFDVNDIR